MTTNAENSNAAKGPIFNLANQVGRGFDIFGTYRLDGESAKSQLIDLDKQETKVVKFLGNNVEVPSIMNLAEQTTTHAIEGTVENRDSFQNKFAMNVGVQASYGFFSGQFSYAYQNESETSSAYKYAFKNVYTGLGNIVLDNIDTNVLKKNVKDAIDALNPDWKNHYDQYAKFFSDYGTHYIYKIDIGTSLEMYTSVQKTSELSKTEIDMGFSAQYKGMFFSGSFSVDTKQQQAFQKYKESSSTKVNGMGGDTALLVQLANAPAFTDNRDLYNKWTQSIKTNPAATNFRLRGIWTLSKDKRDAMQAAFDRYAESYRLNARIESQNEIARFFVGGEYIPEPAKPSVESEAHQGWRFTVLDRKTLKIIHNKYYGFNPRSYVGSTRNMYDAMRKDIETMNLNDRKYIWMVSTYGLALSVAPPSSEIYTYLRNAGGGQKLYFYEYLSSHSASGSVLVRYNMIGIPKSGANSGIEGYADNIGHTGQLVVDDVTLKGLMYRSIVDETYSISPDDEHKLMMAASAPMDTSAEHEA